MEKLARNFRFREVNIIPYKKPIGLIGPVIIMAFLPLVIKNPYYIHLFIMAGINAILAMTFILMLRTGLISLAIASFWGVGAYASTTLVMNLGLSFWLAMPLAIIITGIVAFCLGSFFVKNAGFSFIILTMVFGEVMVLAFGQSPFFGGYLGIVSIPPIDPIPIPFLASIEFTSKIPYYYLMLFFFLIVTIAFSAFYKAWIGRAWMAIGLKPHLAESLGVNLFRYRLWAFIIASAAAALVGSYYAHYYGTIQPTTFGVWKTIGVHIFAIVGGVGFPILGPVIGALIMTFIPEFLRIAVEIEPIITGFILVFIVLFLPNGVLSLVARPQRVGGPGL